MSAYSLVCRVKLAHSRSDKLTPGGSSQEGADEGRVICIVWVDLFDYAKWIYERILGPHFRDARIDTMSVRIPWEG